MMKILDIATATTLNLIFHAWIVPILEHKGPIGFGIAFILNLLFISVFLVTIGVIKDPEAIKIKVQQS